MVSKIDLIIFTFQGENKANEALQALQSMHKEKIIEIINAAVITRDRKGKVRIKETQDPDAKRGALFGAFTGALVGLIGGPVGMVIGAATGAGVGSVAAHSIDVGISDKRLEEIANKLQPDTSAIIAMIEHTWGEQAIDEMQKYGAEAIRQTIREEITAELERLVDSETEPTISEQVETAPEKTVKKQENSD